MKLRHGKFIVTRANGADPMTLSKDGLLVGRLPSCDIVLNHATISRVHIGINFIDREYFLINLSVSNTLTLNGRLIQPEQADTLAAGDVIQLGPYALVVGRQADSLTLQVVEQFTGDSVNTTPQLPEPVAAAEPQKPAADVSDVLKVFWEKRTREKEGRGSILRPTGKKMPGKALINWRPTSDLKPSWRVGLFTWALLIIGSISVLTMLLYPDFFAPDRLSNPHLRRSMVSTAAGPLANRTNADSCTTCHTLTATIDQACASCHNTDTFHPSVPPPHRIAKVGCTGCHTEHKGEDFSPRIAALESCAVCHNDNNKQLYNGKAVYTPHRGTFGYPVDNGKWSWLGINPERGPTVPDAVAQTDPAHDDPNTLLNKQFHALHWNRIKAAPGMVADEQGLVSCASCHNSLDPVDRITPKQTCVLCHSGSVDQQTGEQLMPGDRPNCITCHPMHYLNKNRWRQYLTDAALAVRDAAVDARVKELNGIMPGETKPPGEQ
jgi:FHA domain